MKKVLAILIVIAAISCSKEDGVDEEITDELIVNLSPPDWIQGEWLTDNFGNVRAGYRFTSDNVYSLNDQGDKSFIDLLKTSEFYENFTEVYDVKEQGVYEIHIKSKSGGDVVSERYTLVEDDVFKRMQDPNALYVKQN